MKTIFHFHLIVISSVLLSVDSCHKNQSSNTAASSAGGTPQQSSTTTSNAPATTTSTQITPQPINTTASPKEEEATVRFIASFYSIGEGVDEDLNKEFVKFLDSYPKKIEYEKKNWGRGGEFDYCLALKDFSDAEKDEFARKAKKILSTNVNVMEGAPCPHKKTGVPDEKYRMIVSFISTGEGINLEVQKSFEKFISSYSPKVTYETNKWGREGETDYCFHLSELSSTLQDEFVRKSKEITTKRVYIKENEKCPH